jgi:HD-GYP domain-containing protein (c-di-GMP phosphodiesterase class II)
MPIAVQGRAMASNLETSVKRAEIVSALSHALDITEGQPEGHGVRCAWIGMAVGRQTGMSEADLGHLYYTLLLKDIGCSSNAARICELYLADDIAFKRDIKSVNDSLPQILRFVLSHTGLKAGLSERFRSILTIFAEGGNIARELIETRCQRGADIARRMRFSEDVARGILDLDEHYDGTGKPDRLSGGSISIHARIALLAQIVDVFYTSGGRSAAQKEIALRSGNWFDPALCEAFAAVSEDKRFWDALASASLQRLVIRLAPEREGETVDEEYLDEIAAAFADVVDSKSPYTAGHSDRVALFTDMIAEEMALSPERRRFLKRAALLHDIGKLGVSNQILDKAGKLTEEEWQAVRQHPAQSRIILSRIEAFQELARVAGDHHEKLDGKGYPRGISGNDIALETRIITVADIFDALTAERPYRSAMPVLQAMAIMQKDVGAGLDADCFAALQRAMAQMDASMKLAS